MVVVTKMGIRIMCKYCKVEMSPRREVRFGGAKYGEPEYGIVCICPKCQNGVIQPRPKMLGNVSGGK
jgi:hypothetical protein